MRLSFLKRPLFWSFAAGFASVALYATLCSDMYRDVSGRYALMARAFCQGHWSLAFDKDYSPLTPALGGAIASVSGLDPYTGLLMASGLFYVLAIIPLYYLLKTVLGDSWTAEWGCVLYAIAPKIIRIGCSGLLEAGRNFMLISALVLTFSFFKERRLWKAALLGLSVAGLCMARSECVVWLPFLGALFLLLHWRSEGYAFSFESFKALAAPLLVSLGTFLLGALPRLIQLSMVCGFPVFDRKQADFARHLLGLSGYENIAALELTIDPGQRTHGLFAPERIFDWLNCIVNGAYPIYFAMALIGAFLLARARKISLEGWVLIAAAAFNALLYLLLNLSPRYFNVALLLLMPFTAWLALEAWKRLKPQYVTLFLCAMTLAAAMQTWKGVECAFSKNGYEDRQAGLWLKANYPSLLSQERKDGPLRIASSDTAVNYWAEASCVHIDKGAEAVGPDLMDADFIVVEKRRKHYMETLLADSHFKALSWPGEKKLAVFSKN